jgi:pimeloyl-ACP methyl ester carboxylesterase
MELRSKNINVNNPTLFRMLIVTLLAVFQCCQQSPETDATRTKYSITSKIYYQEAAIDYNVCGSGNLTLLFIHGWCIDKGYWSYQRDGFCSEYRVVTFDLPGFGDSDSDRQEWTIEKYGQDVNTIIEQLALEQVVLVGHSMGGDIMLEAALNNDKVIALVGVDNFKDVGLVFDEQLKEEISGFLEVLSNNYSEVASAYAEGALFHPATDSMVVERVVGDILRADSMVAINSLGNLFEYADIEGDKLSKLRKKLYLINSSNTPTDTLALRNIGVDFELSQIDGTGHYPMIEKPGEFNILLRKVLSKIEANL